MANTTDPTGSTSDLSTRLALDRTRVAYDRTMLAWIRTATSLITFGFGVYKLFQILPAGTEPRSHLIGAHEFGLLLVAMGLVSLLAATFEYRQNMRGLGAAYAKSSRSLSVVVAGLVALLGILALITMLFRL